MKKEEEKLDELTLILNSGDNEIIIDNLLEYIHKKEAEIEEKRIIIFAGAEKVKQLEKSNRSLMESRIKWKNRYYKEKEKEQNLIFQLKDEEKELIEVTQNIISKDKIMAKIEELEKQAKEMKYDYDVSYAEEDLFNKNVKFFKEQMQKLLEEELYEQKTKIYNRKIL